MVVISLILITTLGVMGGGYAAWTQHFTILGNISTGELRVKITEAVVNSVSTHHSLSFAAHKEGAVVNEVDLQAATAANPFQAIVTFTVANKGTVPVVCVGIRKDAPPELEMVIVEAPVIASGEEGLVKVSLTSGYCNKLTFNTYLQFEQVISKK